ncbi:hypothetical protein K458DRAFT_403988 [Lentithecium fluviatile CBS 122367]|uniref:DUF7136 domain-containing protein n=1 Tax=Lentithecium fluviatile CBS 122367 TaxID=1168545 RepID=A0A6G1J1Q0_9PLEO|nr:hypothetical protein K458DRAFT_403988 [Lentithecium fluviatile CBS 122367]
MLLFNPWCLALVLIFITLFTPIVSADNSTSNDAVAEADLLWPVAGETFSLNSNGMAVIFALQNYAEAQKHDWTFDWLMCTPRNENFRECAQPAVFDRNDPTDKNTPTVLRNDTDGNVYIEMTHSFWYNSGSTFNSSLSGVYKFEWKFSMGAYCFKNSTFSEYGIFKQVAGGSFNVTIDAAAAPYPTMTTATCASFLGAVSYTNSVSSWDFRQSVGNKLDCVGTASVTKTAEPCQVTLDGKQVETASSVMGWNQAKATGTGTGTGSGQAQPTNATRRIRAGVVASYLTCLVTVVLA